MIRRPHTISLTRPSLAFSRPSKDFEYQHPQVWGASAASRGETRVLEKVEWAQRAPTNQEK